MSRPPNNFLIGFATLRGAISIYSSEYLARRENNKCPSYRQCLGLIDFFVQSWSFGGGWELPIDYTSFSLDPIGTHLRISRCCSPEE